LRRALILLGFGHLDLSCSWAVLIGRVSFDPTYSGIRACLEQVDSAKRSVLADVRMICKDFDTSVQILYAGVHGSRFNELKKYFPSVIRLTVYGQWVDPDDLPYFDRSPAGIIVLDYTWSEMMDPAGALVKLREHIVDSTKILVYGPADVFELFAHHTNISELYTESYNEVYIHCMDSMIHRLKKLRFEMNYQGDLQYWRFKFLPVFRVPLDVGYKNQVVIQSETRVDVYFRGYHEKEIVEFLRKFQIISHKLTIHFFGGVLGTNWFYLRLCCPFRFRRHFCVFDERFVHMKPGRLFMIMNGYKFKDEIDSFWCLNGPEHDESDNHVRNPSYWVYHPAGGSS